MDDLIQAAQKRLGDEEDPQEQPRKRKRARQSCDACKARKSKCVGIESGNCQYCISAGLSCQVNLKSRKRPFYQVSGEVFEYSVKLLRRFVSEDELPELTVENIRAVLARLGDSPVPKPESQTPPSSKEAERQDVDSALDDPGGNQQTMELDEHPLLQEELGCMVLDSLGNYRYVGAHSSIRWNHAARMAMGASVHLDPKIIQPLKTGLLPPATPEGAVSVRQKDIYLPCRQLCMRYVGRFFDQLHCIYWFYSPEQFYATLDHTLEDGGATASSSWLCSLYSIFALGSMRPSDQEPSRSIPQDIKHSADYLALAKNLAAAAADEADVESIKAFGLLSLAMQGMCYSIAAYLYLGTAARIAFSLGLHRDVSPKNRDSIDRERGRQLWWTIYTLDQEMAIRWGYPCAIDDDVSFMKTSLSLEPTLDPGLNMPLGYQTLSVTLLQLRKKICYDCFLEPAHIGRRLPINRVTKSLSALKKWLDKVPPHLNWNSSLPPQYRRSIAVLHLRYWNSIISVTRPFLLFTVVRASAITVPAKRTCYEELSARCVEAAERSVRILKRMREDETLASLTLFDCHSIGEVMWILILALQKTSTTERQDMLTFCLDTVMSMERIGWCERLPLELEARVHESGVLRAPPLQVAEPGDYHDQNAVDAADCIIPHSQFSGSFLDSMDFNFDGSELDVFETLDFDTRPGLMGMFTDATMLASNLFTYDLDGMNQP